MAYWGVGFWDHMLWTDNEMTDLEKKIHKVLFPKIPFEYGTYCKKNNINPKESPTAKKWLNAKCDVQAIWSHINTSNDIFATQDMNFIKETKKPVLINLGAGNILNPQDTITFIKSKKNGPINKL